MSIEFYEENPPCTTNGHNFKINESKPENAKRSKQFELLVSNHDYAYPPKIVWGKQVPLTGGDEDISFIHETSNADTQIVVYDDRNHDAKDKWNAIDKAARNYKYAEQLPIGNPLKNWPNSKYQYPPGNNSNTFVHEMAKVIGVRANLFESAPGAVSAEPVSDKRDAPQPKGKKK